MRKYEYDALLKAVNDLKDADVAFNGSYTDGVITEEQLELYDRLKHQLDELYIMADMVLSNHKYAQMRTGRRRSSGR